MYRLLTFIVCFTLTAAGGQLTQGQVEANLQTPERQAAPSPTTFEVKIGFNGITKLGHWVPVFITGAQDLNATHFEISVLDGDDQPTIYSGELIQRTGKKVFLEAWMRPGRKYGEMRVRLQDSQMKVLAEKTFSLDDPSLLNIIASTDSLVLSIESNGSVYESLMSVITNNGEDETRFLLAIDSANLLPASWLTFESVSTIIISTSNVDLLQSISKQQWQAIEQWVRNGGQLVFCGGANGATALKTPGLGQFLPGTFEQIVKLENSWQMESFANSREPLLRGDDTTLAATKLTGLTGIVEKTQDETPLVIRTAKGFGEVVFSAIDFDQGPIVEWAGRNAFFKRLLNPLAFTESAKPDAAQNNRFSHFGYDDLAGQLRVPLEQFSSVRFVTFTWVAVLIGLYILCIGPGDYFLLRNVIGKMELTWLSFTLITLLFCGVAVMMARFTRPDEMQVNQLEIIDIDSVDKTARGHLWANVFSPSTADCQVQIANQNSLGFDTRSNSTVTWQGLPGTGLGGMQTRAGAGLFRREYRCEFESNGAGDSPARCTLTSLPVQVSSTKPLYVQWFSPNGFEVQSKLKLDPRIQRLEGTVTNPLNVKITNCRLMFENWTYKLNDDLEPQETFDIAAETREQTAKNFLTRRVRKSNKGKNIAWNPADTRLWRIADMLMFYQLAGGRGYTQLSHDYHSQLDLSQQLNLGRAMLVGEIKGRCTDIEISDLSSTAVYDNTTTIVRIILPVEYENPKQ